MSNKTVFTIIIDVDEDGVPHRRYTGPIDALPEQVQQTVLAIRQRYKYVQKLTERWKATNSNPWMQAVYQKEQDDGYIH